MKKIKKIWKNLVTSFKSLGDDKILKYSASLAYTTIFSMGPLLIVVIFFSSMFFGQDAVEGRIYYQMRQLVGEDAAAQLQTIIKNASISGKGTFAAVIGVIALLFGSTAVFAEIQDSINSIWRLKAKPKKGWWKIIRNRFLSFSLVVSLGFLLLVSLAVTTIVEGLGESLKARFPGISVIIFYIINLIFSFIITAILFALIFKVLPDAKTKWKDIIPGAIASSILFMIGKFAISFYIGTTHIGTTYGAAGSLVILLLWIYYSAIILYIGGEFAKAWALDSGSVIQPNDYAVALKQIEINKRASSSEGNGKKKPPQGF
jgi:membrane protein